MEAKKKDSQEESFQKPHFIKDSFSHLQNILYKCQKNNSSLMK